MERLASPYELSAYLEPTRPGTGPWDDAEGGLAALLVMATPLALASWLAIGVALYHAVT
ncbi:MAG TPA: hypothetical protein VG479_01515 [Gaiellaceae bacterium]|jgi:hypothetical protein|nr:hypothetical protein [Gaiellaceae bacterium]